MMTIKQYGFNQPQVWSTELAHKKIQAIGNISTRRTVERLLHSLNFLPAVLSAEMLQDEHSQVPTPSVIDWQIDAARRARKLVLFIQLKNLPDGTACLHANDARGARYWLPLPQFAQNWALDLNKGENARQIKDALDRLQALLNKDLALFPHRELTAFCRFIDSSKVETTSANANVSTQLCMLGYAPTMDLEALHSKTDPAKELEDKNQRTSHLKHLEDESIHILREAVAEAENPVMMYSVGKDSSVMLHLARKAFYPAPPPFPLLHVDTRWKFQEMYLFRDHMSQQCGM